MDQYTDAGKFRMNVLVLKDGKLGASYTEAFDDPEKVFLDACEEYIDRGYRRCRVFLRW